MEALGFLTDRVSYDADAMRILAAAGYISDHHSIGRSREARVARGQALSEFVAAAVTVLEAELMQHVPMATSAAGYSLRKRRV